MRIKTSNKPTSDVDFFDEIASSTKPVLVRFDLHGMREEESEGFLAFRRLRLGRIKTVAATFRDRTPDGGPTSYAGLPLPVYAMYRNGILLGKTSTAEEQTPEDALRAIDSFIDETLALKGDRTWRDAVTPVNRDNFRNEVLNIRIYPVLVRVEEAADQYRETPERAHFFYRAENAERAGRTACISLDKNRANAPEDIWIGLNPPFYLMYRNGKRVGSMQIEGQDDAPEKLDAFIRAGGRPTLAGVMGIERILDILDPSDPDPRPGPKVVTDGTFKKEVLKSPLPVAVYMAPRAGNPAEKAFDDFAARNTWLKAAKVFHTGGGLKTAKNCEADPCPVLMIFRNGRIVDTLYLPEKPGNNAKLEDFTHTALQAADDDTATPWAHRERRFMREEEKLQGLAREKLQGEALEDAANILRQIKDSMERAAQNRPPATPLSAKFRKHAGRLLASAAIAVGTQVAVTAAYNVTIPDEVVEAAARRAGLQDVKLTGIAIGWLGKTFTGRSMNDIDVEGRVVAAPFGMTLPGEPEEPGKKGHVTGLWRREP